jgi:hypothetical protein
MKIAQGSLEYLILIAVALAVISVVTLVSVNYLGGQQGQYSFTLCKNAAANCKVAISVNPKDACSYCDTNCKTSAGEEIFPDASRCCKLGRTDSIYEGATGEDCDLCLEPADCGGNPCCLGACCPISEGTCCGSACCSSDQVCESQTCITPACTVTTQATDCAYLDPTPCERVVCVGTGSSAHCVKEPIPAMEGQQCSAPVTGTTYQCRDIKTRCTSLTTYTCISGACVEQTDPDGSCVTCSTCRECIDVSGSDYCAVPISLSCDSGDGSPCGHPGDGCTCCIPVGGGSGDFGCNPPATPCVQ